MVTSALSNSAADYATLRQELALRVLLQNLLLLLSLALFAAFSILALAKPDAAWGATTAQGCVSLGAVLQWCHHAIRTKQIKEYLLTIDDNRTDAWERWLPAKRPQTLLGSRWMISTKGVFLGLQLVMTGLAQRVSETPDILLASIAGALFLFSAGFLLTNPKE